MDREKPEIKTLVFFDLESTGLYSPGERPPRITELCMMSVQREDLLTRDGIPRVVNKITLCVDPGKVIGPVASQMTGLYNDALETQSPFDSVIMDTLTSFLSRLPKPVCLVAHYGNGFDFRLLATEMERVGKFLPSDTLCADSIEAFRGLEESVTAANEGALNLGHSNNSVQVNNNTTPTGQLIDNGSMCEGVKQRAKQLKRKASLEAHGTRSVHAKAVRKRLFDTSAQKNDSLCSNVKDDPSDVGVSELNSGAEPSRSSSSIFLSNKNIEEVKQRLMFSSPEKLEGACKDGEVQSDSKTVSKSSSNVDTRDEFKLDVQQSLTDEILVAAVTAIETQASSHGCMETLAGGNTEGVSVCVSHATLQVTNSQEATTGNVTCSVRSGENKTSSNENVDIVEKQNAPSVKETLSNTSNSTEQKDGEDTVSLTTSNTNSASESDNVNFVTPLQAHQRPTESSTPETVRQSSSACSPVSGQCQASDMTIQAMDLTSPNAKPSSDSQDNDEPQPSECTTPRSKRQANKSGNIPIITQGTSSSGNYPTTPTSRLNISFKLEEIYRRTFGCKPPISHTAEDDCVTLMKVAKRRCPQFIHWVDQHALPLSYMRPFY